MITLREARFRHANHYSEVAQRNKADFTRLELDMVNILRAGDFWIESEDSQNLPQLTDGVSNYLFKRAVWDTYVELNLALLRNDEPEAWQRRKMILKQLGNLEEIRGNYQRARFLYKQILERNQFQRISDGMDSSEPRVVDDTLEVLGSASRLAQIQGDDDEALAYAQQGLALARSFGMPKEEVDCLLDIAALHRKHGEYERVHDLYDVCIQIAEEIGYGTRMVDILMLKADLFFLERHFGSSMQLSQRALERSLVMGDQIRAASIREQIAKLNAVVNRKVFISYSNQNRVFVERLAIDLRAQGLAVWWAEWEIKVGDSILQKLSEGMLEAGYLVVVLSPASIKSPWVQLEVNSALMKQVSAQRDITVLTLLLEDCEIPILLAEKKWADFRYDYDAGLRDLLTVLLAKRLPDR